MRPQLVVDQMIQGLAGDSEMISTYLVKPLERDFEHFPNIPATSPETWIAAKRRLDNYLHSWRTDLYHISNVHRRNFYEVQKITDEIRAVKWAAEKALAWQHETKLTPEKRLKALKTWADSYERLSVNSPDVLLYRETRRLYKFSWEKHWIDTMDGLEERLSQSVLDKRNRDFKRYVDRLRRELEEEVSVRERVRRQRPESASY